MNRTEGYDSIDLSKNCSGFVPDLMNRIVESRKIDRGRFLLFNLPIFFRDFKSSPAVLRKNLTNLIFFSFTTDSYVSKTYLN